MQLHLKKIGEGKPFIILHGLFGSGDNWMSFARMLSEKGYAVYQVDLRNHGRSPHAAQHSLKLMSDDVFELIKTNNLEDVILLDVAQDVQEGSAAEKAGLKADDVITEVDGKKVKNVQEVREALMDLKDKSGYNIKAKRGGSEMNFDIKVAKHFHQADI